MMKIILWILGIILAFAMIARAEEIDFGSIPTGEYALVDGGIVNLLLCNVDFVPRLYVKEMVDGISNGKNPMAIQGRKIGFVSSHQSTSSDSLNPFNPGKIVLSELIYLPELKIWRRLEDVPLEAKTVSWGQRVSILSPKEELKPGTRYALFYEGNLCFYGTTIPLSNDLRAGVYYFTVSDSNGQ
jgi:hypothetical protein